MHLIDLRTLHCFVRVAECESISGAARLLHISASPLSRTILNLEARIGFALFDRIGRNLRLNNAGRELLINARTLLRDNERLMLDLQRRASGSGGTVVIGHMPGALYNGIIPDTARRVQAAHPSIRFQFESSLESEQLEQLHRGRFDFAIQTQELAEPALTAEVFATENYVVLLPSEHPLARAVDVSLQDLIEAEWVLTPERTGPSLRSRFLAACRRQGFEPRVACVAGDIVSALALVAHGFGLCVAQESLVRFCGEHIVVRALPRLEMQTRYRIVWRPDALGPAASHFLDALLAEAPRHQGRGNGAPSLIDPTTGRGNPSA